MIRVWSDRRVAGTLDRSSDRRTIRGSTFSYDRESSPARAVSVTMPVRVESWNFASGLAPIFDMNLPEGQLREHLRLRFAKALGSFDDFDLLSVVGRTQIGRIRYSAPDAELTENVPFQSIDDILRARRGNNLFDELIETFAAHSGLSGVQPKIMIRGKDDDIDNDGKYIVRGATHIVKFWQPDLYQDLAANEYFCLSAARAAGLAVPSFQLSDDGAALVIERFDLETGIYLGFEDFCVLNGLQTSDKYRGGYETRLFKRLRDFILPGHFYTEVEKLFRLFILNCSVRNGDAHLKNFGIVYKDVNGPAELSPVYDIVTTTAYMPNDGMALTLNGSTNWPNRSSLVALGQQRADLSKKKTEEILEETADAMASIGPKMRRYFKNSDYAIGARMDEAWNDGIKRSLGLADRTVVRVARPKNAPRIAHSDGIILEYLREHGGSANGTQKAIAAAIGLPESTFSASLKRLFERNMIAKSNRRIELIMQEV